MTSIGVLASGGLGLSNLVKIDPKNRPAFVMTDKASLPIQEFCRERQIPFYAGNPRKEEANEFIETHQADIILSINYLFIVDRRVLNMANDFAINFHGSLLPKYRGRTPHVWAIINNEKETGVTAHLMNEELDHGDVVLQRKVAIESTDTGANILQKFEVLYPEMVQTIIDQCREGNLQPIPQDDSKATYFEKRTPDDGEINWEWQKERIYNWVRAQAKPYPGAFTSLEGRRCIIHRLSFSDEGFRQVDENGKILGISEGMYLVKTPNGAVRLEELEGIEVSERHIGKILK